MPMWTRQHFRKLAEVIRNADMPWSAKKEWAATLANVFEEDNRSFDRFRFLEAAGVMSPECPACGEPNGDHLPGCALQQGIEAHPAKGVLQP